MSTTKHFNSKEAREIGEKLGIDWTLFDVEQFRIGMDVELEHGSRDPNTNVTNDDPINTGKIALAHLNEFSDYYTRLIAMEHEAELDIALQAASKGARTIEHASEPIQMNLQVASEAIQSPSEFWNQTRIAVGAILLSTGLMGVAFYVAIWREGASPIFLFAPMLLCAFGAVGIVLGFVKAP